MATVGRAKRKRAKTAGSAVKVTSHKRLPRGPNVVGGKRKPVVRVSSYKRGKPS